jgi:hexokinase
MVIYLFSNRTIKLIFEKVFFLLNSSFDTNIDLDYPRFKDDDNDTEVKKLTKTFQIAQNIDDTFERELNKQKSIFELKKEDMTVRVVLFIFILRNIFLK